MIKTQFSLTSFESFGLSHKTSKTWKKHLSQSKIKSTSDTERKAPSYNRAQILWASQFLSFMEKLDTSQYALQ